MSLFAWKPEYSVGCPEIDQQHERLFHMADELHRAMLEQRGKAALAGLIERLAAYTESHFASEERLMQETGYTKYLAHRREHLTLAGKVREHQKTISRGEAPLTVELMTFLSGWLKHHVLGSDAELGVHVRNCLRRASAGP